MRNGNCHGENVCRCIFLQFKECEFAEDEIAVEERFSLQNGVRAVQGHSTGERDKTLTLLQIEVVEHVF